jgi:hypothetical protein
MTDWDQLNAMGNLARLNQAKQLAAEQAARDSRAAAQNAEVVRLLKEQKAREDAEKGRVAALPKCPDCRLSVEVGARRCPQCHIALVSWDYVHPTHSWRLICRTSEAQHELQQRCNALVRQAASIRDSLVSIMSSIDDDWHARTKDACLSIKNHLGRYAPDARKTALLVIDKLVAGELLSTPQDDQEVQSLEANIATQYSRASRERLVDRWNRRQKQERAGYDGAGCFGQLLLWGGVLVLAGNQWDLSNAKTDYERQFAIRDVALYWWPAMLAIGVGVVFIAAVRVKRFLLRRAEAAVSRFDKARQSAESDLRSRREAIHAKWMNLLQEKGVLGEVEKAVAIIRHTVDSKCRAITLYQDLGSVVEALECAIECADSVPTSVSTPLGGNAASVRSVFTHAAQPPAALIDKSDDLAAICKTCTMTFRQFSDACDSLRSLPLA